MALGFVSVTVQMSYATTRGRGILKIERFQILIGLNDVMLVPRLGADNISSLHIKGLTFCHNFGLATEDQPVLVAVMVMAIGTAMCSRNTEYAGTGYAAPLWQIVLPHFLLARSDYWHVASSSAVVLNFYIALLALCNLQFRCPA